MPSLDIEELQNSVNIAMLLTEDELQTIGNKCLEGYMEDVRSRRPWEQKMSEAMKLALQLAEKKNTPWENASNVLFPLISIASINFNARIHPQLFSTPRPVKMRVIGGDDKGEKHDRASRVAEHMSYQCTEEDEPWVDEHDTLTLVLPIMGCGFTKTYYDDICTSEHVHAKDFVVNYYTKSLETCPRYTHIIPMWENEIIEKQREEVFLDIPFHDIKQEVKALNVLRDDAQGLQSPNSDETPNDLLEQGCLIDLDGDGYKEPYTVTLDMKGRVYRIVNRFKEIFMNGYQIRKITQKQYFTPYTFIPSPDGGFYGYGFGHLLTPINSSVNTVINQLIDSGTLANRQGGFIGRGARLKGGKIRYKMGEYVPLNSTGDDIRKNIFPMPFKEPSQTLFTLMTYLVEYGERLSAVSDMMQGKTPGQNTPATTAMAALEEGMKVFTSIYQRVYRGLKKEFKLRYLCNQEYLDPEEYYIIEDDEKAIHQKDYLGDPTDIRPTADQNMSSDVQRLTRIEAISQRAQTVPGYNTAALERRFLENLNMEGIDEIFPVDEQGQPVIQPPDDPKIEIESAKFEAEQKWRAQEIQIKAMSAEQDGALKEAQAILALAKAEEIGDKAAIEVWKTAIAELKVKQDGLRGISSVEKRPADKKVSKVPK